MRNPFARKRHATSDVTPPPPVINHLVNVDLRTTGEYFVLTYSFDHRLAIHNGPPVVLPPETTAEQLGAEVLAALLRSSTITAPADMRTDPLPARVELRARAKVKTETAYMRGTREVSVYAEFEGSLPGEVSISPQQKVGGRGARESISDKRVTLAFSTTEALGSAVLASLDDATA